MVSDEEDDDVVAAESELDVDVRQREVALLTAAPPPEIQDLADACVRFVERAVGVKLDFTPETLPLLDHYLAGARRVLAEKRSEEPVEVVAQAAGAYLGEVIRRRFPSFWVLTPADPAHHKLRFMRLFLTVLPMDFVLSALTFDPNGPSQGYGGVELEPEDRDLVMARLRDLPEVTEEEFLAPSTRFEVVEIAVDAVTSRQLHANEPPLSLEAEDYLDG
jgi:hypothetical protein